MNSIDSSKPVAQVGQQLAAPAPAPTRRAPTPARPPPAPRASAPARGRCRCAGAGRRRTRADSGRPPSGSSPTRASSSRARAQRLGRAARRARSARRRSPRRRVRRGLSEANGSWNTICMLPPHRPQRRCRPAPAMSAVDHDAGRRRRRSAATMQRASVDLPEPDSPTTPSVSPRRSVEADVLDRARTAPAAAEQAAAACDRSCSGPCTLQHARLRRWRRAAAPRREAAARRRAAPACRRAAGWLQHLARRALSRPRGPCCITATRSAISATTPKSWVMNRTAMPCRVCRSRISVEDLRLRGDVERGGRLVGDQQRRARAPAPWRSSRAGAGRRRARAGRLRSDRSGSGRPTSPSSVERRALGARRRRGRCARRTSRRSARRSRISGFSAVIGSWKIMAMRPPRTLAQLVVGQAASRSRPSNRMRPGADAARAAAAAGRITALAIIDLPEPDSPTTHRISPLRRRSRATRRRRRAAGRRRPAGARVEVLDRLQGTGGAHRSPAAAGSARRSGPRRPG